jgi:alanyl-tRNA synthetase
VIQAVQDASPDEMRQLIDVLRRKQATGLAVMLISSVDGKVQLVAGLSKDLIERGLHAGNWLKEVAPVVGGGGGGRPDLAQAGGKSPDKINTALEHAARSIKLGLES